MKHPSVWFQGNGSANQIHGRLIPAHLMRDDSQKVQRLGMVRIDRQNLAVNGLCLGKPSGSLMLESEGQGLGDSHDKERFSPHHCRHMGR